ncbi:pyruvate formate-lyase-activating protein [Aminicella lysinilytica]|uniref:Pyruvate formate-lyase-activating enzyme n=1 Tax=Aminicella lysinilytica TaxID=433323 RepID=A0A4R6Q9N0_9FIRM|nr:pyruvate formate-lyase-activating protein [Aminicella lysinilytica]TDP59011.1 pyruvate formate lyase activating enzyme [Aminicella lysinilytica]
MKGRLHSIESFGAVDGPGIRTVFFMQGCPARCAYCHNPDTWNECGGREIAVDEIVHRAKRGLPYYGNDGGVTFSGGEPLLQGKFLLEAIEALKAEGIASAIDTSGTYIDEDSEDVIAAADMVLLDIKHIDPAKFEELTGREQGPLFRLIDIVNRLNKPIWIRQVIIPGFNDNADYIEALNEFISDIKTVKKVELLGYHNMAENKYERLGIKYRLKDIKPMNADKLRNLSRLTTIA